MSIPWFTKRRGRGVVSTAPLNTTSNTTIFPQHPPGDDDLPAVILPLKRRRYVARRRVTFSSQLEQVLPIPSRKRKVDSKSFVLTASVSQPALSAVDPPPRKRRTADEEDTKSTIDDEDTLVQLKSGAFHCSDCGCHVLLLDSSTCVSDLSIRHCDHCSSTCHECCFSRLWEDSSPVSTSSQ